LSRHIDLLGLLYVVAGALSALVASSFVALGLGAFSIVLNPASETSAVAAGLTAGVFLLLALILLVWAGISALAGRGLRRRRRWARLVSIGLAVVNLFILPFGTALGVYALWVLVHNQARQAFELPPTRAGTSPPGAR
jgi:hypothetical protein